MNRRAQLEKTLEFNLNQIRLFPEEVELVLVNFIKDEEGELIDKWIRSLDKPANFKYFVSRELAHWHAPTAKNTAHMQGEGGFLINLDCDNFLSRDSIEQLLKLSDEERDSIVFSGFTGQFKFHKVKVKPKWKSYLQSLRYWMTMPEAFRGSRYKPRWKRWVIRSVRDDSGVDFNGTYGHIGMPINVFHLIGGYDQEFPAMGAQDKDLMWRAYNLEGMELLQIPQPRDLWPVENDKSDSLHHSESKGDDWDRIAKKASIKALESIKQRVIIANIGKQLGVSVERIF